jgi:hypothetical protein
MESKKMESLNKKVPVTSVVDVLVIGGGPAGIAAAISSSRNGCRTMIVERGGYLGGMATAGLVMPIMPSFDRDGKKQIIKGVFEDFVQEMMKLGGAIHPSKIKSTSSYTSFSPNGHDNCTPFDPEIFKIVAYRMLQTYGCILKLHTWFVEPLVEGNNIVGGIFLNKSGFEAIRSTITIDCTGDADVARLSGCSCVKGREKDGIPQPVSLFFRLRNVDSEKVKAYRESHPYPQYKRGWGDIVEQATKNGDFPVKKIRLFVVQTLVDDTWAVNVTRLHDIDATNVNDLTKAEILLHEQVMALIKFFNTYVPGFEHAILMDTAHTVGIRESYRIIGEYTTTVDDINSGKVYDDVIGLGSFAIDIHDASGTNDVFSHIKKRWYQIPYRSMLPLEKENLLVAGRAVSATHEAAASIRVMSTCFATGHAAGTAASIAINHNVTPRVIDIKELRSMLLKENAVLDDPID